MDRRIAIYLILVITLAIPTISQNKFREGIIVTNALDTINGFIEPWESDRNPTSVNFQEEPGGEVKRYTVEDLAYFSINSIVAFQRHSVNISMEPVELKKVEGYLNLQPARKTVFLRVVQRGRLLTLFAYEDDIKPRFYTFSHEDKEPQELVYKVIRKGVNFVENYAFRDYLKYFGIRNGVMPAKLEQQINRTLYEENQILKVVSVINGIKTEKIKVEAKEATGFRVGAGVNLATLNYVSQDEYGNDVLASNATSTASWKYWVSVGYDLARNPLSGKLVFRGDISFSEAEFSSTTYDYRYSRALDIWHTFKQRSVTLGLGAIYNFVNNEKVKVYVGAGGRLNFASYDYDSELRLTTNSNPPVIESVKIIDDDPRKLFFTVPFTAGVVMNKKIELRIMYSLPATLSHDDFVYKYGISYFQGGIQYHF